MSILKINHFTPKRSENPGVFSILPLFLPTKTAKCLIYNETHKKEALFPYRSK